MIRLKTTHPNNQINYHFYTSEFFRTHWVALRHPYMPVAIGNHPNPPLTLEIHELTGFTRNDCTEVNGEIRDPDLSNVNLRLMADLVLGQPMAAANDPMFQPSFDDLFGNGPIPVVVEADVRISYAPAT